MIKKEYSLIGNYKDLEKPGDRIFYRMLEIFPGALSWGTLLTLFCLSWFRPIWVALFIIVFDLYWLARVFFLSVHLIMSYRETQKNLKINWLKKLESLDTFFLPRVKNWRDIYHFVIMPTYKEGLEIIRPSFKALTDSRYPLDKVIIVLAIEERAGGEARKRAEVIKKEFARNFKKFLITVHPKDIIGEIAGKGSNETWAGKEAKRLIIDQEKIPYENIIVSVFDIDTRVYPDFFSRLTYQYLITPRPTRVSYQPVPVYNNNIWDAPSFARVVATSSTFWQMMLQEMPERLSTYSSHSMSFKTLAEIGFWQTNIVSEDSRILWQCKVFYNGDYKVIPLYYPVSMDACLGSTLFRTAVNQYKQQRRWAWGVENVAYITFNFLKNKKMPWKKKLYDIYVQIEGFHSWATNALVIMFLGWLPVVVGGEKFKVTVLSYNLPNLTSQIMTIAMFGLVIASAISTLLLPPKPRRYGAWKRIFMTLEWFLLPITIMIFGCLPGLEAQTRLMLGRYMGFWVTEKKKK